MNNKSVCDLLSGTITLTGLILFLLKYIVYDMDIKYLIGEIILCTAGIAGYIIALIKLNTKKRLISKGERIKTKVIKIEKEKQHFLTNMKKYYIVTEWINPENNEKIYFYSKSIYFDPTETIIRKNIDFFYVYLNKDELTDYHMDLELLAK